MTLTPSDTPIHNEATDQARARATERKRQRNNLQRYRETATKQAQIAATATMRVLLPSNAEKLNEQGYALNAQYGLRSGIEFKKVGAREIGHPQFASGGFIDAIDIWGYAEQGYEVCFPGIGKLVIMDARTMPRVLRDLTYFHREGMTCAQLDYQGTVILLPESGPAPAQPPAQPAQQPAQQPTTPAHQQLTNCMVTLTHILNFRETPGGTVIGHLPYGAHLTALERTADWFKVDYWGRRGWVSADYVLPAGDCG